MRILHIAAHLGGGIGKAHASMVPHMPRDVEQTFALLENPIDRRHVEAIEANGARVVVTDKRRVRALAEGVDIVQVEYWGHPALDEALERWFLPSDLPSVCWCHVSGLHKPALPLGWAVSRFVATSPITLPLLPLAVSKTASVINSGFGFERMPVPCFDRRIVYLGTVDFKKLHPDFFSAIDKAGLGPVEVWGHVSREVATARDAMRRPDLVIFQGHTLNPEAALLTGDIFFYPLARNHYGTAENALVEAMSLGLAPVVLNNPAEMAIVKNGETGLVARDMKEATECVDQLIRTPSVRTELARNAMRDVNRTKRPFASAMKFAELYRGLMAERYGYYGHSAYA